MKIALVTGAGGFIGRSSLGPLLQKGFAVHAVVGRAPRAESSLPPEARGAHLHVVDLLDEGACRGLLESVRPTHLLHFAWIATPGVYWTSPDNVRWLAASRDLLRLFGAYGGIRAVMAGSCAEYDWTRAGVCHEDSSPLATAAGAPVTPYAHCKIALQESLREFAQEHTLSTAWGRIFFQYGPCEPRERLVASVILSLLAGREALTTHGRQIRSFLHVADVAAAFVALLDSSVTGAVNIGSDEAVSLAELLGRIAARLERPALLRLGARPAPPMEPALLLPDVTRLRDEVGWTPQFSLDAGLGDTIEWWRKHA